jgi:hypothetical protein
MPILPTFGVLDVQGAEIALLRRKCTGGMHSVGFVAIFSLLRAFHTSSRHPFHFLSFSW